MFSLPGAETYSINLKYFQKQLNFCSWNKVYTQEISNWIGHADIGEIWFGSDAAKRIVKWLNESPWVDKDDSIIDLGRKNQVNCIMPVGSELQRKLSQSCLAKYQPVIFFLFLGCGNGMLLIDLWKQSFTNLNGVDYSEKAIELATSISKTENCKINYHVGSILIDPVPGPYKVVLDKGTYDAVCLDPDDSRSKREIYKKNVYKMLEEDGIFVLTSCNWTEAELIQQFSSGKNKM